MPVAEYEDARRRVHACRAELSAVFAGIDVLVTPSAPGVAPDLATTGDPIFNRAWSALGTPVVNVPAGTDAQGLPLGVQVVGPPGEDARTLACAAWIEAAVGSRATAA